MRSAQSACIMTRPCGTLPISAMKLFVSTRVRPPNSRSFRLPASENRYSVVTDTPAISLAAFSCRNARSRQGVDPVHLARLACEFANSIWPDSSKEK
jgi:hypothetical protein